MVVSNRNLLFQGSIFRFHVCFGGCRKKSTSTLVKKQVVSAIKVKLRVFRVEGHVTLKRLDFKEFVEAFVKMPFF